MGIKARHYLEKIAFFFFEVMVENLALFTCPLTFWRLVRSKLQKKKKL